MLLNEFGWSLTYVERCFHSDFEPEVCQQAIKKAGPGKYSCQR